MEEGKGPQKKKLNLEKTKTVLVLALSSILCWADTVGKTSKVSSGEVLSPCFDSLREKH